MMEYANVTRGGQEIIVKSSNAKTAAIIMDTVKKEYVFAKKDIKDYYAMSDTLKMES